jgi:hypothetical protein
MENQTENVDSGVGAVQMTRRIRDRHYEQVKDLSPEERMEHYQKESTAAHARFLERMPKASEEES